MQAVVFLLVEMSLHPELISPLRQEIEANWTDEGPLLNNMELLDSIVQESARLNSSETISLRRKATNDYTFSDGVKVKAGTAVYAPLRAMGRDPDHFNAPDTFDGYRFLKAAQYKKSSRSVEGSMQGLKYTDINLKYPYWGYGLDACPGRFYAAFIIKTSLVHIIRNFDIKLEGASKPRVFSWRTTIIPSPTTQMLVRRRQMGSTTAA
ncbi:hypothetical protein OCU04_006251 [Sclerotinia nivalis]|uniref:Cytochrome P450 n=1 Tax=Sclerotinia nivalis TaxID=352851 RepID=A0A9X0AML2_9HELO|nr:hypothetical protein OCU04_006251 [Sclerotinia nivalis]